MDPQTDLPELIDDLDANIDELGDALAPLLSTPLHTTASSLPLLDKSKLYVLSAYAIESLLFSALTASGVDAKEHALFKELGRLKGYFAKIKEVEARGEKKEPASKLDVGAANRFIKAGLAGNEAYDRERAEKQAKEKARAQVKAVQINKKFEDEDGQALDKPKKRAGRDEGGDEVTGDDAATHKKKKHKYNKQKAAGGVPDDTAQEQQAYTTKRKPRHKNSEKKMKKNKT